MSDCIVTVLNAHILNFRYGISACSFIVFQRQCDNMHMYCISDMVSQHVHVFYFRDGITTCSCIVFKIWCNNMLMYCIS